MQKLFRAIYLISLFFLCACHNKETKQEQSINNTVETQSFFPVTEFLLGQLTEIDSLPLTPLKIIIDNDKRDSFWLKKSDIRAFAIPFLSPLIDSVSLKNFFVEKSFMDQTINLPFLSPIKRLPDS
jgi:hypothetical protein